jgi:uncharacterized Zn-binding protein involved in type VI secretion
MAGKAPSRISQDQGDLVFVSTNRNNQNKVFINNVEVATEGSITASGASVVTSSTSVFIDNKGIARESDLLNNGVAVRTGAPTVCVGD